MPVTSDAKRALALLERVQQKVTNNDAGNGVASQVQTDLDLLTSLLQNPVLRNILKLEDSLEELNQHLMHHPSLLPSDFDIDKSGTLVVNQNILQTNRSSFKTKGGKSSPSLSNTSSSKQSTVSPETHKRDVAKTGAAFQQSILQAAAKREIIAIQLNKPEGQSLGFSVVGLRSDHKGDLGIFVQEIQPTGIAGRDGRLAEGDQILAIDGQVLEAAISHQAAIGILQRARGVVDLVVARGVNPEVPHIPLISLQQSQQPSSIVEFAQQQQLIQQEKTQQQQQQQQHKLQQQLSSPASSTRSRSSQSSQHSAAAASSSSRSASPQPPALPQQQQQPPAAPLLSSSPTSFTTLTTTDPIKNNNGVDVVEIITTASLAAPSLGRSPSALSDGSKTGGDMVLNTEWAQVEVVDLINDGSGLGFGIIGGRSTGVVVKTIVPGGVSDRDGRLQSGDHILQIGEVSLRGMGSEQVAAVLRQSGTQVRLVVARPIEPTSPDYQGMSSSAPIVPTKVLGDPEELERHLAMHQNGAFQVVDPFVGAAVDLENNAAMLSIDGFDDRFIFTPPTLELQQSDVQLHVTSSVPRGESVIQLSGSHLSASTTEETVEMETIQMVIGQTPDLTADMNVDYLPEVENFEVQLKKDAQGLGITIAGYVCEREELSGIFVKSINPGSVADLSGRIQINDQIVEVDGQSLRGFNNHQAVEVLRSTGQVVCLTLARYLRGPKYDQLQQAMAESTIASVTPAVPSYRPPSPPPASPPPTIPRSPPPALPVVFQDPKPDVPSVFLNGQEQKPPQPHHHHERVDSLDASPRLPQVPEPESDQLMDLDRFDPLASPSNALDYSSLSPEELEKLIDHVYSAQLSPQCEAAIIAKWRSMVEEDVDIVVAQLSKFQPSGGLGISLEGTVDVEEGREVRPHHYIRSILPEGPVGSNGILHSGDELLEVNGRKLLGLSHVEVVSILKDLPQSVRMVCARRQTHLLPTQLPSRPIDATQDRAAFASRNILGGSLQSLIPPGDRLVKAKSDGSLASTSVSPAADSPLSKSHRSRSLEPLSGLATWSSEPQVIELVKGERGLGFSILDYQDPMNPSETIIVIRSLVPGGVAQQDGRLIPGDRLLFVNDINLENASLDEAVQVLKGAPRGLVQIGVAKPHPVSLNESGSNGGPAGAPGASEMQRHDINRSSSSRSSECSSSNSSSEDEYVYQVQEQSVLPLPPPPPLPQTEPPDTDSSESEMPNPLLVNVATERLLLSSGSSAFDHHHHHHPGGGGMSDGGPLPSALERTVRIKKGGDPLGINVEVVDGGASGVLVTSVAKGGAVHRDGRIRTGDFLVSVNHETMRFATNAQARAILRRTQLVSTDVSIVYIPAGDAAIYRQTTLMTQLAQDMDSNASVVKPSSSSSTTTTMTRIYPQYYRSPSVTVPSPRIDPEVQEINSATLPPTPSGAQGAEGATASEHESKDSRLEEPELLLLSEEEEEAQPELGDGLPASKRVESPQLPIDPAVQQEPAVSSSISTTIAQVAYPSANPPVAATNGTSGMMAIYSRHWGPERSVQILRDPTKSLGISIVGGKVDVASGSGAPITGIFIKNVLPESPAGRTGQLRTGDRILDVDGEDLREASHERAVEVIRKAGNRVTFLVQSLVDFEQDQNGITATGSLAPSVSSRYQSEGAETPTTDAEHLTPLPSLLNGDLSQNNTIELPKVAPSGLPSSDTPMPEVIQSGFEPKPVINRQQTEDDDEDDDDGGDTQGRTITEAGMEIERASAGNMKLTSSEKASDPDQPDDFGYTQKKIHKKWGDLKGEIVRVDLDRTSPGGGALSTVSLGLSLAGHKDRTVMAVFICGLNPSGIAFKDGRLQVGDELVEVNGNVLHGRCHLNASAIIKSIGGARVTIIVLRREGALQEVAVPPITRFPISLEEQPPEERYSRFKNLRIITLKKGSAGLGIMIIEGRHADVGSGIFISDIQRESVAEEAGLAVGDMILCVNKDELLGADYDTAAGVLKKAEGILTIVVSNPKTADPIKKEEPKPKLPPKPAIAPKPASMSAGRLGLNSSSASHNVSSTSLPSSSAVMAGLDVHSTTVSSQSAPQSPLNAPGLLPSSRPVSSYSPSQSPSPSMAAISASSLDANVVSDSLTSTMATATATPVDPLPSLSASSSSSSFLPSASLTAPAVVTAAGRTPGSVPASSGGGGGGGGYKGVAMGGSAGGHQGKAVLRQHGGPSSHSKSSVGGNLVVKVPDEPLPDPTVCEVKPGKETTIEVNKDKLGLGLSIVGGSDTLLGAILIHEVYPDGAAARDKRLKPGDQILEVNGESFRNITHSRALAVLRQTPAKVRMMVYRDETSLKDDDMLDIIEVELLKKPGRGLGLSIVGRRNGPGVYISDVVKGGAAEADGRLMQGDQILTVNGNDLRTASQEQAAAILKTAMGKIDLKVGRLKAGAASPRSATSAESSPASSHLLPPAPPIREDSLPSMLNISAAAAAAAASSANDPPLVPTPTTPPPPPPPPLPPVPVLPVSLLQLDPVNALPSPAGALAAAAASSSTAPPTFTRIVLERGADGLGFSIVGGLGNPQGDLPIFVKTVFERGAAAQSNLRPGDQIHAVDSTLLDGKTHQEAVALLKNAKGTVTLTIVS
ncbi:multiple PDZ domain protein-like isoform X4 [Daphnia pulex]|uniref:multiple PDZ domain protein-like isoform X4 n=1 Tax=Daphnia pulex TaxID=6669 RepID=UPI001EDF88FF|nr:multiple PDZ domain protein-like isoform X4 [Daphnia pulex]